MIGDRSCCDDFSCGVVVVVFGVVMVARICQSAFDGGGSFGVVGLW